MGFVTISSIAISTAVVAWIIARVVKTQGEYQALRKFGVPDGNHWLLGHLSIHPGTGHAGHEWVRGIVKTFKKHFIIRFGFVGCTLAVCHPDTAKVVLKTTEPKAIDARRFLGPWLGDGLLLSSGRRWGRSRRLLTPAFHFGILKSYLEVYNDAADRLCGRLEELSGGGAGGGSVEVFTPVSCSTLDIILRCAFSMNDDDVQNKGTNHPYVSATIDAARMIIDRAFNIIHRTVDWYYWNCPAGRRFAGVCKYLHDASDEVIAARKKELKGNPALLKEKKLLDFLDILLTARDEDGEGLTDAEVRAEVDTFMFEGHDTTASAIAWIMKELAYHPADQQRCQAELDDLLRTRDSHDLLWDDLSKLPYTTQCIKESLRLNTPVPLITRTLTKDLDLEGLTVPKGTSIDILVDHIHWNPDVWGNDALEYKPERMSPENMEKMDSYAFIPFSAGPRNCIGQNFAMNEIKVTIAKLLSRFTLKPDEDKVPKRQGELVMRAEDGLHLRICSRP